jgi:hypothetical protein
MYIKLIKCRLKAKEVKIIDRRIKKSYRQGKYLNEKTMKIRPNG